MQDLTKDLLIIDIETVSQQEQFEKLPEEYQKHWNKKASFIRNEDQKTEEELYRDRAAIYAEFGKVIVIGMAIFHFVDDELHLRVKSISSDDEGSLLSEFKEFLESKFDQDSLRLCAHNGKEFDFPYLCRRMLVNNIKIPWSLNLSGKKPWEVNHLDTMEMWKFGDWKSFTSLELLTTLFDIPSSKSDLDGSLVTETYYGSPEGLRRIEQYCKHDVVATSQLLLRMNNLPVIPEGNIAFIDN